MDNMISIRNFNLPDLFIEIYLKNGFNNELSISIVVKQIKDFFKSKVVYFSDPVSQQNKILLHVDCYDEIFDQDNFLRHLKSHIDFSIVEKIIVK